MSEVIALIAKLLGIGNGASFIAQTAGVINWAGALPVLIWLYAHKDETVDFRVSLSTLLAVGVVALFYLELNRRAAPKREEY